MAELTPEQWQRIKDILASALEVPVEQRQAFIERACGGDAELQARVEDMITSPVNLTVGDLIDGQYQIERLLGRGGFGQTYLALDRDLKHRSVVIKVLFERADLNPHGSFDNEVEALSAIRHPGVVAPLRQGVLPDGRRYLVMEFVDGVTLGALMQNDEIPLERAAGILRQIGNALGAVHSVNILHRDVKPTNVMIETLPNGEDHLRLIDFGIARRLENSTATGLLTAIPIGTPSYMAPEQFTGRSSKASDIYAMAAIAYDLVTGSRRETDGSLVGVRRSIAPRKHHPLLPQAAEVLILQGLSEREADRPQNAAAFGENLSRALTLATAPASKRPMTDALLVLLVLCMIGGIALVSRHVSPAHSPTAPHATACSRLRVWLRIEGQDGSVRRSSAVSSQLFQDEGFRIEAEADSPGYLYLFTEPSNPGGPLTVLFPSSTTHGYSSYVPARTTISIPERAPFGFKPGAGADHLWIVWADTRKDSLENVTRWAKQPYQGMVHDMTEAQVVRQALQKWQRPVYSQSDAVELRRAEGVTAGLIDISHK